MNITGNTSSDNSWVPMGSRIGPYIATELVIAFISISGNMMVCITVRCNRNLHTVTNYFLVSLAVADFFVGALAIPCAIITDMGIPHHNLHLCVLLLSVLIVLTQSSVFSLLAIAVERYIAILLPLHYQRLMRPLNAKVVILVTWILAFLMGSVPLMGWHKKPTRPTHCHFTCVVDMTYMVYFNFFGCTLAPLLAMFFIYSHIFVTVRRQARRIAAVRTAGDAPQASKKSNIARPEARKATSLFLLLFLFMVCWIPLHTVNCVTLFCPECRVPQLLQLTTIILSHANSALNPLLYAYRMKSFRQTFRGLVFCERVTGEAESSRGGAGTPM